jgi:diguanylate cyclase (GGDEF)-like protein
MHRELLAALSHAARYGESFALVFIDLNHFKAVNDRHGHDAGDRFLSGIATLLEQAQRDSDRFGRWGGDEFVALLPHATRTGAQQFAERLQEKLGRTPIDIGPTQVVASASLGLAVYPDDGVTPEALLAHADEDMYRAKRERDQAARLDEHA